MNSLITAASSGCCRAAPVRPRICFLFGRVLERLRRRHEQTRLRRELAAMPDYLLKDMGVTREDLYREYRNPSRWW